MQFLPPIPLSTLTLAIVLPLFLSSIALAIATSMSSGNMEGSNACDTEQFVQMPCRCCKMNCWYGIARTATHELGHIPGQQGEEEALSTLRLIRACMIAECSPLCSPFGGLMKKRRFSPIIVTTAA